MEEILILSLQFVLTGSYFVYLVWHSITISLCFSCMHHFSCGFDLNHNFSLLIGVYCLPQEGRTGQKRQPGIDLSFQVANVGRRATSHGISQFQVSSI